MAKIMPESLLNTASGILANAMARAARGTDFRQIVYDGTLVRQAGRSRGEIRSEAEEILHAGTGYIAIIYDGKTADGRLAAICEAWNCVAGESLSLAQPYRKSLLGAWKPQGGIIRLTVSPEPLTILPTPGDIGLTAKDGDAGSGAEVTAVATGSPAEQAGLRVGDIITLLGEQRMSGLGDLVWAAKQLKGGKEAIIAFTHDGQGRTSTIMLRAALYTPAVDRDVG